MTGLSKAKIKDIENGFFYPNEEEIEILSGALSVQEGEFDFQNDDHYMDAIDDYVVDPNKPTKNTFFKIWKKVSSLWSNMATIIASLVLMAIPVSLICYYSYCATPAVSLSAECYGGSPRLIYEDAMEKGTLSEDSVSSYDSVIATYCGSISDFQYLAEVSFPQREDPIRYMEIAVAFQNNDGAFAIIFDNNEYWHASIDLSYFYDGVEGSISYVYKTDFELMEWALTKYIGTPSEEEKAIFMEVDPIFGEFLEDAFLIKDSGLMAYSQEVVPTVYRVKVAHLDMFYNIYYSAIALASLIGFAIVGFLLRRPVMEETEPPINNRKVYPLKPEIRITPFVKEGYLRILAITLFFLASWRIFLYFAEYLDFWGLSAWDGLSTYISVLSYIQPIAVILIFFLKISTRKLSFWTPLGFLLVGMIFYGMEALMIYEMQLDGDLISLIIVMILPKNIFFPLGVYCAFSYFLLHYPKPYLKSGKKAYLIAFRLANLIPIAYMVLSLVYTTLVDLGVAEESYYRDIFLGSFPLPQAIFILVYVIAWKAVSYFHKRRLSEEDYYKYLKSNRFQFTLNIVACLTIIILSVLNFLYASDSLLSSLGFQTYESLLFLLLPFIFFYRIKPGKRNLLHDYLFIFAYGACMALSYVLIYFTLIMPAL